MADTLAAALWLAERGLHVFEVDHPELPKCVGVRTREHDPATCTERGKHPYGKWSTSATVDRDQVTAMFAGTTRNIGIACGPSGLLVVDEDVPGDFARYAATVGQDVMDTFTVTTGKGSHFYFRQPNEVKLKNEEGALRTYGVNIRGAGGYVVGPGSTHTTGIVYTPTDVQAKILPCPPWLVAALTGKASSGRERMDEEFVRPGGAKDHSWWRDVEIIHHPNRHNSLIAAAGWCRTMGIPRADAVTVVRDVWRRCCPGTCCRDEQGRPAKPYTWDRALGRLDDAYERWEAGRRRDGQDSGARWIRLTPASAIKPRPVRWTWTSRIPAGEFTLTPGRGGIGKSTFHVWTVGHLTRGSLPGVHFGTPKPCIIAAAEDSWERTIVPRLIAAGADMHLVYRVDVITETDAEVSISLPRDLQNLEVEIVASGAVLLSVDPVMSVIANGLDSHKDADVRQALTPLARLADRTGCAVLGNAHFNKSSGSDPLSLVMGSAAFGNVARAALGFARDTEAEDESCVISQVKNNLGRLDLPSLRYRIDTAWIDTDEGQAEVGKLVMLGESDRSVADILRDRGNASADDRSDLDEAGEWIVMFLTEVAGNGYAPAVEVIRAGSAAGFPKHTLQRARKRVGIRTTKADFGGGWVWVLPEDDAQGDEDDASRETSSSSPSQSPSVSCAVCELPLDEVMAELGETTHPTCDPWPDTFDPGTVGAEVNEVGG